jgi:hypothetical protein
MKTINERFMYYAGILAAAGANIDDLKHISDLLDLEEQERLIKLPCKVGDTVYCFLSEFNSETREFEIKIIQKSFEYKMIEYLGETVFLTKEEAEKALAEMGE